MNITGSYYIIICQWQINIMARHVANKPDRWLVIAAIINSYILSVGDEEYYRNSIGISFKIFFFFLIIFLLFALNLSSYQLYIFKAA